MEQLLTDEDAERLTTLLAEALDTGWTLRSPTVASRLLRFKNPLPADLKPHIVAIVQMDAPRSLTQRPTTRTEVLSSDSMLLRVVLRTADNGGLSETGAYPVFATNHVFGIAKEALS